jgi:8-oxo-dGTP diphosphatase
MTRRAPTEPPDDDAGFLATYDASAYPHPSVAVDVALLTVDDGTLRTLLLRRDSPPHRGRWSLPGGFVGIDETLDAAAARVLEQKTGIRRVYLEQLYTFGALKRDPRTRVITVAHYALVDRARLAEASADARVATIEVPWEGETGGPIEALSDEGRPLPLAFDHADILGMAVKRVRGKLDYTPIGFQLLSERFTLSELLRVHETVLGRPLNKDSFRRRMLASGQLEATGDLQTGVDHRPAELYRFARRSAV